MTADGSDVAAAAAALDQGNADAGRYHRKAGARPGVGESVHLPTTNDRHGRGYDLPEADSVPSGLFTDSPVGV